MRAVIYTRVSTEDQAKEGMSLQAQKRNLTDYANENGYIITKIYSDEGISGKSIKKRKALQQLLKDADNKEFDIVLIYKLDRLSRSVKDSYSIIDTLIKNNIGLVSLSDKHIKFDSPEQRAMFGVSMVFAQLEVEQTSERVTFTMADMLKDKRIIFSTPYGYIHDKENKKLIINEEEADVVRRIFNLYVNGYGTQKIAMVLNTEGIKSPNGSIWRSARISSVLKNKRYIGICEVKFKRISELQIIENFNPPIIDQDTFNLVAEIRKDRREKLAKTGSLSNESPLFTSRVRCASCGNRIIANGYDYTGKRRYRCEKARFALCDNSSFYEHELEDVFVNELEDLNSIYKDETIEIKVEDKLGDKIAKLNRNLQLNRAKIEKCYLSFENDLIDLELYKKRSTELKEKEKELLDELDKLNSKQNTKPKLFETSMNFKEIWSALNNTNKKKFLTKFIDEILIVKENRKKVKIIEIKLN